MRKSTLSISKNDLYNLSVLLSKGYSINESLNIIGNHEDIIFQLKEGEKIERFIDLESKSSFFQSLHFFLKTYPLDQAILSAYEYEQLKKQNQAKWLKEISYPIIVFFFSILIFIFFEWYIYPQLSSFSNNANGIQLHNILYLIIHLILNLGFILIFLIFILFFYKNNIHFQSFYKNYIGKLSIIRKIFTYEYALHYVVLMNRGLSTKQVFDSLIDLKKNKIFQLNLNEMIMQLNQGIKMIDIIMNYEYFDSRFKHFFKIGYYTQNLEMTLKDYCIYQQKEFEKMIKISSRIISTSAYLFTALLIISIYQLLLLPLGMINQF